MLAVVKVEACVNFPESVSQNYFFSFSESVVYMRHVEREAVWQETDDVDGSNKHDKWRG